MQARKRLSALTLLVSILIAVQHAGAQSPAEAPDARLYFNAGARAYAAGKYAAAVRAFEEAYRIEPRPGLVFSVAQAYKRQYFIDKVRENLDQAIRHYRKYLELDPDGARRGDTAEALSELEPLSSKLAPSESPAPTLKPVTQLMISSPVDDVTIALDGKAAGKLPYIATVSPGVHRVKLSAGGYLDYERDVRVLDGSVVPLDVTLEEKPATLTVQAPEGARVTVDGRLRGISPAPLLKLPTGRHFVTVSDNGHEPFSREISMGRGEIRSLRATLPATPQRTAAWAFIGVGSTGILAGGGLLIAAVVRENSAKGASIRTADDVRVYNDTVASRDTLRTAGIITAGSGVVAAGIGLLLYAFDEPRPSESTSSEGAPEPRRHPREQSPGLDISAMPFLGPGSAGALVRGVVLMLRTVALGLACVVCAAVFACADLPTIALGVCGNGVVEPDKGEDCDGPGPRGSTCGEPSSAQACRYTCHAQTDCPEGFTCGVDGICRAPSSTWSVGAAAAFHGDGNPLDVVVADTDGDRRGEVIEQGANSVIVHYDSTTARESELSFGRDSVLHAIGPIADLSGDHQADAVVPVDLGYFVSLGTATRVERAKAYGAIPLPESASDVQALSAEILPDQPGSELVVLAVLSAPNQPTTPVIVHVSLSGALSYIGLLPDVPSKLAGPMRAGRLDEKGVVASCDSLVFAYKDAPFVDVLVPCKRSGSDTVLEDDATAKTIALPSGVRVAGPVLLEDLNADGHLDLGVVASRGQKYELDVAYGAGDGSFASSPENLSAGVEDGRARTEVTVGARAPLAVFDLDGDRRLDWVDATGIYLSRGSKDPVLAAAAGVTPWTSVLVDQLDADSLPDVAVGSVQAPDLTIYFNGGEGTFTPVRVATQGNPTMLNAGDFDGDRIRDLALVTSSVVTSGNGAAAETLSVVFGSPFGAPSAPKDIGEFHHIEQVATARVFAGEPSVVDGADEIGALAQNDDDKRAFALIFGKGNRDLRSPYGLTRTELTPDGLGNLIGYVPLRIMVGDVQADGIPDVISIAWRVDTLTDTRIWSNPMGQDASIQTDLSTVSEPVDGTFDWPHVLAGAVDMDGKPGDELLVMGPSANGPGYQYAIANAVSGPGGATLSLGAATRIDEALTRTESGPGAPPAVNGRLRTADIDGDGTPDVLALAAEGGAGKLAVYYNEQSGALGEAAFVPEASKLDVRDFALVQAPGDRRPKIGLLTSSGVYVVTAKGRTLSVGSTPVLTFQSGATALPNLMAAGDVDGDGVQDLALAGPAGFEVHLGISNNPRDGH